jgi:phosphoadenosine phosphosulfate reductase
MSDAHAVSIANLQARFEKAHPQDVLRYASDTWGEKLTIVTSFQPTGIVTIHMMQAIAPQTPILTLDTGYLFPQTVKLMDELEARWQLNLHRIRPEITIPEQNARYGDELYEHDPDKCCHLRKVLPLQKALAPYDVWLTGLRRDQAPTRTHTPIISKDERHNMLKIAPFATWTEDMIWAYIHAHDLPYNILHDAGYPSIGCAPCTRAVESNTDLRAGRWMHHNKTECGIHRD